MYSLSVWGPGSQAPFLAPAGPLRRRVGDLGKPRRCRKFGYAAHPGGRALFKEQEWRGALIPLALLGGPGIRRPHG